MPTRQCIIIEDDQVAQQYLLMYLTRLPYLNVVDVFENPLDALPALYSNEIDLLFLDMHLPGIDGLDFLKSLSHPPRVIITTADPAFALDAFEAGVTDYLVKPFSFERLLKAVNRAITVSDTNVPVKTPTHVFF